MDAIKSGGIQVEESMAPSNMSTAYNRGSTVMIRDDLNRDLQECVAKIREHDARAKEYNGWVQVLDNRGERVQRLGAGARQSRRPAVAGAGPQRLALLLWEVADEKARALLDQTPWPSSVEAS
jgi:hypothetical protein